MIDLYTCRTANGYRASIMLEECALPYTAHAIDLVAKQQKEPWFLAINPTGRLPAIVDRSTPSGVPLALAESLAIAVHAAEKSGRFIPSDPVKRALAWQWGAIVVSGFSAAAAGIFFARQIDAAAHEKLIAKYFADVAVYLSTMEQQLAKTPFLAGDQLTFADLMAIPTILRSLPAMKVDLDRFEAIGRWSIEVGSRPGVIRGLAVPG